VELQKQLSDIGQFAELAHGSLSPDFIWNNMDALMQTDFPLQGYDALSGSKLLSVFHGTVSGLQGYIAYRPAPGAEQPGSGQLIVAFSGTSSIYQALRNLDLRPVSHPVKGGGYVHSGFWKMYDGIRLQAIDELVHAQVLEPNIGEIVFTGHSMGGAMSYLFALDVLGRNSAETLPQERPITLTLALFGSPRVGNQALVEHWRTVVAGRSRSGSPVNEYSVKGYNDGVPTLPLHSLGYRHLALKPLYLAHGRLFHVPDTQPEHSFFPVDSSVSDNSELCSKEYPLGGHNYYNNRDMEKLLRKMKWFSSMKPGNVDWKEYRPDWDQYKEWLRKDGGRQERTGEV